MKKYITAILICLSSHALGEPSGIKVKEDATNIHVTFPGGLSYHYSKRQGALQSVWSGVADVKDAKDHYSLHIIDRPWQSNIRSLGMTWAKHEVGEDNVSLHYKIGGKGGDYAITEIITLHQDKVVLDFSLKQNGKAIPLNYRLDAGAHQQVITTGQPRGRGTVQYLKPGQTQYRITVYKQKTGPLFPAGYSLSGVDTPKVAGREFEPTGMDFDKDGTLYVTTRAAGMWSYRAGEWKLFADGLYEPLGVKIHDGKFYVIQKPELTRISDTDGDGTADLYETVSYKYRFTGDYHAFAHGPVMDSKGDFYFATNLSDHIGVPIAKTDGIQMKTTRGYRGWVLKAGKDGSVIPYASGFRTPSGTAINDKDEIFITDNQGDWVGSSFLVHVREGGFHGHPASLLDTPEYGGGKKITYQNIDQQDKRVPRLDMEKITASRILPTVWLPHNEYANSPGSPVFNTTEKFGPFKGQLFVGDFTKRNILRISLEKVGGAYQGAVFHFARPLPCGAHRIQFDAQGRLWIGEISRGWGRGPAGIQVLQWDGKTTPYEMHAIKVQHDGFRIEMTKAIKPVPLTAENLEVTSFRYNYWANYGSEPVDRRTEPLKNISLSADQKSIALQLPLEKERIYSFRLRNIPSTDGEQLVNDTACYTLNRLLPSQ